MPKWFAEPVEVAFNYVMIATGQQKSELRCSQAWAR